VCAVDGHIVASCYSAYDTEYLRPNWAEQNPHEWVEAVCMATNDLLDKTQIDPGEIAVISLSGHMQGATLVDRAGTPLRSSILWADQRALPQAEQMERAIGRNEIYHLTGSRVSPAYTAAKVMWVRDNQPELFKQIYKVLQCKDYIAYFSNRRICHRLFGCFADTTAGYQPAHLGGRSDGCLGPLARHHARFIPSFCCHWRRYCRSICSDWFTQGTPVVIGGGDGSCATVGACSIKQGDIYNYIGSSSWIAVTTDRPVFDIEQRTFNIMHLDPDLYVAVGSMQAAGGAYSWLEERLRAPGQAEPDYDALDRAAGACQPGGNGLLFLPYLLGERSPYWNPAARGAFIGLTMPDGRAEMARAVLEGVAFNQRIILESLMSQGVQSEEMRLIGGGSKSAVWRQILADIYEMPVTVLDLPYAATALGAAIAGGVGVGIYPDYSVAQKLAPVIERTEPQPETYPVYQALYPLFKESYTALEGIYDRLGAIPKPVSKS
jgi:xylulokinase